MGSKKKKKNKRTLHTIKDWSKGEVSNIYTCFLFPWRETHSKVLQTESSTSVTAADTANQKSYELAQRTEQKFLRIVNTQAFYFKLAFIFKQELWSKNDPFKLCQLQLARRWKDIVSLHLIFPEPLTFGIPFIALV